MIFVLALCAALPLAGCSFSAYFVVVNEAEFHFVSKGKEFYALT